MDGVSDAFGKADINSLPMELPSIRSMIEMSVLKGNFLDRVKSVSGHFAYFDRSRESISRRSSVFKSLGFIVHLLVVKTVTSLQGPLLPVLVYDR